MNEVILSAIKELQSIGISNVDLLALVTDTSYEVIFYGTYKGERLQSNEMVEKANLEAHIIDGFYKRIATAVRETSEFDSSRMNILQYFKESNIKFLHDEKNCRIFKVKKEWKSCIR